MTNSQMEILSVFRECVVVNTENKTIQMDENSARMFWRKFAEKKEYENVQEFARLNYRKVVDAIRAMQFARSTIEYHGESVDGSTLLGKWHKEKYPQDRIVELINKYMPKDHAYQINFDMLNWCEYADMPLSSKQHTPRKECEAGVKPNQIVWVKYNNEWNVYSVHPTKQSAMQEIAKLRKNGEFPSSFIALNYPPIKKVEIARKKSEFISQLAELDM